MWYKYQTYRNIFGLERLQPLKKVYATFYVDVALGRRLRLYVYFGRKVKSHVKCDAICGFSWTKLRVPLFLRVKLNAFLGFILRHHLPLDLRITFHVPFGVRVNLHILIGPVAYRGGFWAFNPPPPPEIPKISVESSIAWARRNGVSIFFCSSLCSLMIVIY